MKNIYFVKNDEEYTKAIAKGVSDGEIYFIDEKYPYFRNKDVQNIYPGPWQVPINIAYWLSSYKEINKFVTDIIQNSNIKNDKIAQSDFFQFDIVRELGKYFLYAIDFLDYFFTEKKPCILYYNNDNNFISTVIESVSQNHGIKIREI